MTQGGAIGARAVSDTALRDLASEWGGAALDARRADTRRVRPGPAAGRRSVPRRP